MQIKNQKIAFIGAGNMAESIIKGLLGADIVSAAAITVSDIEQERVDYIRSTYGVGGVSDNTMAAEESDIVILAVKPQVMDGALSELSISGADRRTWISMAAGISTAYIETLLGDHSHVVRIMPNTPVLVGLGATAICGGRWVDDRDLDHAERLLGAVGVVVRVEEKDMNAVTAVSGSGPAYVFYLFEAMLAAARQAGLDEDKARLLIGTTIRGAAVLVEKTKENPGVLRKKVTSKGGMTEAALSVLENQGVFDAVIKAIQTAEKRAGELSKAPLKSF